MYGIILPYNNRFKIDHSCCVIRIVFEHYTKAFFGEGFDISVRGPFRI